MFQQCLDNGIMPFIVLDSTKGVVVRVIVFMPSHSRKEPRWRADQRAANSWPA